MSNSIKKEQNRQKELAYMRKVKQTMQPKSDEERQRERAAEIAALPRKGRVSNFFYHYKVQFILAVVLLAIAAVLIGSILNQPKHDLKIMAAYTTGYVDVDKYSEVLSAYGYDLDGNGEVKYNFISAQIYEDDTTSRPQMMANMQMGDLTLFLFDDAIYEELIGVNEEAFTDLSELFPDHPNVDGRRFFIKGTQLEEELGAAGMPDNLALVLRVESHAGDSAENQEKYETSLNILKNIVNDTKTETD